MKYLWVKRLFDILLSLFGLIVFSPVFLGVVIAIKLDTEGPVLFRQKRVGIHKTNFNILKFRTMRIDTPKDVPKHMLINPEQWITRTGRFLRRTSLDELPQIWNVLTGQMTIIGPRPALWNQEDLIAERDKYGANDIKPGVTGWAQINGRDGLSVEVKAKMDGEYVRKMGFWLDFKCFFKSFIKVFKHIGVIEGKRQEEKRKHILIVSQYYYPEQFRINDISTEWVKKGYKVTVVTGIPNYPQGKFFEGYGLFKKRKDENNGVNIIRIPIVPRGKNPVFLGLNYISFVISGFFWKIFTGIRADYVFIFGLSPILQALPGVWYARKRKIPCYLYVQDLWPESLEMVSGISNKRILGVIGRIVDYIYQHCTMIFTTSESFLEAIAMRNIPRNKLEYWPQYAEDFYMPIPKKKVGEIPEDGAFNIIFTGNIGNAQGLDILPETAERLRAAGFEKKIRFNIVGDGRYRETLEALVKNKDVGGMFNFIPKQPPDRIPHLLAASDAAFLCLTPSPVFAKTIPAKLQSYLACGIPVIASAEGETEKILRVSGAGVCVPPKDVGGLAEKIIEICSKPKEEMYHMGNNASNFSRNYFSKTELLNKMDRYFE
ncbi:sugar transferase [Parasporobacterium paucivorans]|uniref:Sugar transferase involved in LPS biosynthesis (Colanic, teichoic acid) n=1 Tax=Parasporobacterium paucivorans DSM 15970 TaxID=1122934 RepID=A0A1M6GU49_9FIRM|nr:sugar transferase [Parasporobacterium paucivorans]SHJ13496.1 Sugar transferase involved in LPS biosynthesis (colanic, teichoic acid) [Parasporobacterium paucivorans DSM 15970]